MTIYLFGPPGERAVHRTSNPTMRETLLVEGFVSAEVVDGGEYIMPDEDGGAAIAVDVA